MTSQTIQEVMMQFTEAVKQTYGPRLREVILYGSCARGNFTPESDIDVMVLLDVPQEQLREERNKILDVSDRLDLAFDTVLAPVFQNTEIFERYLPVSGFYQNVRHEGIRYA